MTSTNFCAKGVWETSVDFDAIEAILQEIYEENACLTIKDLALNGHDLMQLGYQGPAIGQALQKLLDLVLDEQVTNTKTALLHALTQL